MIPGQGGASNTERALAAHAADEQFGAAREVDRLRSWLFGAGLVATIVNAVCVLILEMHRTSGLGIAGALLIILAGRARRLAAMLREKSVALRGLYGITGDQQQLLHERSIIGHRLTCRDPGVHLIQVAPLEWIRVPTTGPAAVPPLGPRFELVDEMRGTSREAPARASHTHPTSRPGRSATPTPGEKITR